MIFIKLLSLINGKASFRTNYCRMIKSCSYYFVEYGVSGNVSAEGDVYSYGILLLEMFTGRRSLDDIFQDGLTLHDFVKTSLFERVMEIMDPHLVLRDERDHKTECYMALVLRIGITCSIEFPRYRMEMRDVVNKLHSIKNLFLEEAVQERRERAGVNGEVTSYNNAHVRC